MPTVMIRLLPTQLNHAAQRRAPGFLDAFKAIASDRKTHFEIERSQLEALNLAWPIQAERPLERGEAITRPTLPATKPAPTLWPMNTFGIAARALKLLRAPGDTGVGDTLARVIGPIGGDAYKAWFKETFGKTCG